MSTFGHSAKASSEISRQTSISCNLRHQLHILFYVNLFAVKAAGIYLLNVLYKLLLNKLATSLSTKTDN